MKNNKKKIEIITLSIITLIIIFVIIIIAIGSNSKFPIPSTPTAKKVNTQTTQSTTKQPIPTSYPTKTTQQSKTNSQTTSNYTGSSSNFSPNGVIKKLGNGYDYAKLHSDASSSSSGYDLGTGTPVQILNETNGYYYVDLDNGNTGYIYAQFVTRTN